MDADRVRERLIVPLAVAESLLAHARRELPNEACGLLAGDLASASVTRYLPARNADASPTAYSLHPEDLVRLILGIEDAGEDLVAVFHSHTRTPAVPSATDCREAHYPGVHHLLVTLVDPAARPADCLRAWRIEEGAAGEVRLELP